MNMLIRFFIMMALLKQQLKHTQPSTTESAASSSQGIQLNHEQLFSPISRSYRVLPHDMGWRDHLPNYRYLSFIELNITKWIAECCHHKAMPNLLWIISMQEMVYLKEVRFLDKLTVKSQLEGWDKKYLYFQHHFFVNNSLMAIGMTKFMLKTKKELKLPQILVNEESHPSAVIDTWNAHQTAIKSQN